MIRTRILGTGCALPPKMLTNDDLSKLVDTNDAWITERTGIRQRRVLDPSLAASDLATQAAREACRAAGVDPSEIECIIVGTVTPDLPMPATAVFVQQKLGCPPGAAFDLSAACAGFVYGMGLADSLIKSGQYRRVLVIGVEILTRILDWKDRNTCVLFGDGAGAAIFGAEEEAAGAKPRGILSTHLFADGAGWEHLYIPGGGSKTPTTADSVAQNLHTVKMNGRAVFSQAVRHLSASCMTALEKNQLTAGDVDVVVAHQANQRILEAVSQRCGIPMSKFFLNIHKYGNTSSASIPIALDEAVRAGFVKDGQSVLMCALGAGFSWGSALVRW